MFGDKFGNNAINVFCPYLANCSILSRKDVLANIVGGSDTSPSLIERIDLSQRDPVTVSLLQVVLGDGNHSFYFDDTIAPTRIYDGNGRSGALHLDTS